MSTRCPKCDRTDCRVAEIRRKLKSGEIDMFEARLPLQDAELGCGIAASYLPKRGSL